MKDAAVKWIAGRRSVTVIRGHTTAYVKREEAGGGGETIRIYRLREKMERKKEERKWEILKVDQRIMHRENRVTLET